MGTILSRVEEPLNAQEKVSEQEEVVESSITEEDVRREDEPGAAREEGAVSAVEEAARRQNRQEELRSLKEDLAAKRARRREALDSFRRELEAERAERLRLEALLEESGGRAELEGLERQVKALKDVAKISGDMLRIRELQVNELKEKLNAIEETGVAYEKEVENIRKLKALYEERSRAMAISHQMEVEREKARVVAAETRLEIAEEKNRELVETNKELQERISTLDTTIDKNNNEVSELRVQLAGKKEELYNATSQITIVNSLFSQLLTDPESLDRVTRVLEEHHDLVNHLTAKGNINDVASVLMTVADKHRVLNHEEQCIATNLSKVWRLLVELLGYHNKQSPGEPMPESCYKSVDTPTGPKLVISVSQTFLRLKDLILEKNSLMKEVGRLKELNTHLETRLISQESRLVEVAEELHKTWGVVTKLKTQHKAIHTHEQVLRYELKHKRLMLNELKQQLEECREMWQMARVKNNQTEKDWNILRKEFADRKQQISSAESGYEESPGDSQDEEDSHKISDDESDIQDFPISNNPRCLRIRRIQDSELSTPERSNTPDLQISETTNAEETDSSETNTELKVNDTTSNINEEMIVGDNCTNENVTSMPYVITLTNDETLVLQTSETIADKNITNECQPPLASQSEDDLLELETGIEILPWNDSPNENIAGPSQLQVRPEMSTVASVPAQVSSAVEEPGRSHHASDTEKIVPLQSENMPITKPLVNIKNSTAEELLARREVRLKRLEEQCKNLFDKMNHTNKRSDIISTKLLELHEQYGDARGRPSTSQNSEMQEANQSTGQSFSDITGLSQEYIENESGKPLTKEPSENDSSD